MSPPRVEVHTSKTVIIIITVLNNALPPSPGLLHYNSDVCDVCATAAGQWSSYATRQIALNTAGGENDLSAVVRSDNKCVLKHHHLYIYIIYECTLSSAVSPLLCVPLQAASPRTVIYIIFYCIYRLFYYMSALYACRAG